MTDEELVEALIPHWYATRIWAEELLIRTFGLKSPNGILATELRGKHPIPGSNWVYRTHGIGVDIGRDSSNAGGIDFDFNKPDPDAWRLEHFARKQFNIGNLPMAYKSLIIEHDKFQAVARTVLVRRGLPVY